ncbi:MAG: VOC family protein [Chromatiaceae bacterium]|nr:VOC family protein [Gammaproteobacteria bacterium]MCP5301327.1 VOC family protein [Chromatiaceae bacterium]MCP5421907.1 VOC family protein [Chromatiaceae bacterium]
MRPTISRIDHLVLTVKDIEATSRFYNLVLGMEPVRFADDRHALVFGAHKINLHQAGREFEPKARVAMPGSTDLCLLLDGSLDDMARHLNDLGVTVIEGPVRRTGARGPILSLYFRDPDGNLIEVAEPLTEN